MEDKTLYEGYADWDKAMLREPPNFRYQSLSGIAQANEYKRAGVAPDECGEFAIAREKARLRLLEAISDSGMTAVDVYRITGCEKTLLSRMKNGQRTFCAPPKCWEAIAYDVMHISVQDLIFGERRPIILPRKYALPAAYMLELLQPSELERFAAISKRLVSKYYAENDNEYGHHRTTAELIRERLSEIREEKGYYKYNTFGAKNNGAETPNVVKPTLYAFWDEERAPSEPKFSFIAYAALYSRDQGIDYLVCEDPLRGYSEVYAVSSKGEAVLLTGSVKEFWRNVLILDNDGKQQLMEMAWGAIYTRLLQIEFDDEAQEISNEQ